MGEKVQDGFSLNLLEKGGDGMGRAFIASVRMPHQALQQESSSVTHDGWQETREG